MANPIVHCLERLSLDEDKRIRRKAEEFQGQLSSVPAKFFDKGPNCKVVVCIQLAHESLGNFNWDLKLGAQLAGCKIPAYEAALSIARQRLNVHPTVTFEALTVALGSSTMLKPVKELWAVFEELYQEQFTGAAKSGAKKELEMPCWKGAAIFCCAKAFGEAFAKENLHVLCGCTKPELNKCIKIIETTCSAKITELKSGSTRSVRGKRTRTRTQREGDDANESNATPMEIDDVDAESDKSKKRKTNTARSAPVATAEVPKKRAKPISGIVSMIDDRDYTTTKAFKEYNKWKSSLIDQLRQVA